jgi:predicted O-linked N-acetylglucosamine transferase (SPINDLY family)
VALKAKQDPAPYFLAAGNRFYEQKNYASASEQYQQYLELTSGSVEVYLKLGNCFEQLQDPRSGITTLQAGLAIHPKSEQLYFSLIMKLLQTGRTDKSIAIAQKAALELPNDYTFKVLENLIVPIIYQSPEEIERYYLRFQQGLNKLIVETHLETQDAQQQALAGIGRFSSFYLTYQAKNIVSEQRLYGELIHQVMAANYPEWIQPLLMPSVTEKIRIGYVSNYLHSYSGTLWLTGWLRYADQQRFEVYCYYTGNSPDPVTQQFRDFSHIFHHIPSDLKATCQQILSDKLHLLVFPEIGMDPLIVQMAALRLAPVQCNAWGHPVTSGLPTIDYYLSSELMEPENGQDHYTETLVRLPNLGIAYPQPAIPALTKSRTDFGLRPDAVVYLCCQAPFKYLPQHDFILAEIAHQVHQAQFVFIRADALQERLYKAFAALNLNSNDYCIFLPVQARNDYLMLNLLSDIYLDTIGFTGGNTTLDAVACGLPVVTCPTDIMRGRLSSAILQQLGITSTIAKSLDEYIQIAVNLGLDVASREAMTEQTRRFHKRAFDDQTTVRALEEFYERVVRDQV